jgi:hypothetical protein
MYAERPRIDARRYRVSPSQTNDEWGAERPRQPRGQLNDEERQPGAMPALGMRDEHRLTGVE